MTLLHEQRQQGKRRITCTGKPRPWKLPKMMKELETNGAILGVSCALHLLNSCVDHGYLVL